MYKVHISILMHINVYNAYYSDKGYYGDNA